MAQYVYKGLTETEKEKLVKAHAEGLIPPEKRGKPLRYRIDKDDTEEEKEEKRKLTAKWKREREAEIKAEVEKIDAAVPLCLEDKTLLFEKGKPVTVPDGTVLAKKLDALCGIGKPKDETVRRAWEKVEEKKADEKKKS